LPERQLKFLEKKTNIQAFWLVNIVTAGTHKYKRDGNGEDDCDKAG